MLELNVPKKTYIEIQTINFNISCIHKFIAVNGHTLETLVEPECDN